MDDATAWCVPVAVRQPTAQLAATQIGGALLAQLASFGALLRRLTGDS